MESITARSFEKNLPALMGLLGLWYKNFFGAQSIAILPYETVF